jgi:putative ABC transport system substrate-binding protein
MALLSAAASGAAWWAENPSCEAAVAFRSGSEAYDQAVAGVRETLASPGCRIQYVDAADPAEEKSLPALAAAQKLTIAVGVGTWEKLSLNGAGRIVAALVLRQDLKTAASRPAGAVYADVPLLTILEKLHDLFPEKLRAALIRRPSWPAIDGATLARARQMGYELRIVECRGPEKLLSSFSTLKGKADVLIAEPDTELYNSATVKPLVLASLEARLPIVGFSPGFVRAGALVGVYPDFRELGRQTGELAAGLLSGKTQYAEQEVRKVVVAVNPRMVRLLGMEPARQEGTVVLK